VQTRIQNGQTFRFLEILSYLSPNYREAWYSGRSSRRFAPTLLWSSRYFPSLDRSVYFYTRRIIIICNKRLFFSGNDDEAAVYGIGSGFGFFLAILAIVCGKDILFKRSGIDWGPGNHIYHPRDL
jgi:hypothetical protein